MNEAQAPSAESAALTTCRGGAKVTPFAPAMNEAVALSAESAAGDFQPIK
jgi:hypothetical protein